MKFEKFEKNDQLIKLNKFDKQAVKLCVVTDRTWLGERKLADLVKETLQGGATMIQLREKKMGFDEYIQEAKEIKKVTDLYNIPLIINDQIEVAMAVNADGVHVGQKDMFAKDVRILIGPNKIIGVSARTVEQAILAEENGADYIGVGAVFSTTTKLDAKNISFETLQAICKSVSIPVIAIGGISENNLLQLKGSGVDGVAVISAVFAQPDIQEATNRIRKLTEEIAQP